MHWAALPQNGIANATVHYDAVLPTDLPSDLHTGCKTDRTVATSLASATLGNSRLVAAVERVLGDEVEVAQFGSLLTRAGDPGAPTHFDYKPYRVLGSSLRWLVAVVPLTDYTADHGPLMVSPGAHRRTNVLPAVDGRVHPVDVGTIRCDCSEPTLDLLDPQLHRGDLFLFNGFTFHFAAPNRGPGRSGLYIKFRAKSAPSACGPLLFPTRIASMAPTLLPYHRLDGTQRIDKVVWILEDALTKHVCVVRGRDGEWRLPSVLISQAQGGPMRQNDTGAWDQSNVIGECLAHAEATVGRELGWLSWVADHKKNAGTANEQYLRVYGHISSSSLTHIVDRLSAASMMFASVSDLAAERRGRNGDDSSLALVWIRSWQQGIDPISDRPVRRGFGVPLENWNRRGAEFQTWRSDDSDSVRLDAESLAPGGRFDIIKGCPSKM
eukprot:SAG31_NODE_1194_length_9448_cov_9.896887_1_plen_438_part_00